jgi:CheY-like chemotaxis protein
MARILVVDDDPAILAAMHAWLDTEGFEVELAGSGRKGIAAVSTTNFDVAIVDIFMPDVDGLETIGTLVRLAPGLPIIATSGFLFRGAAEAAAPDLHAMSTKLGAACCLQKPFRPRDLLKAIRQCLNGQHRADVETYC